MPAVETSPIASAQVLRRRVCIIGEPDLAGGWGSFGTIVGDAARLRDARMITPVNNLSTMFIEAYQYPRYVRGDATFEARVSLEWRVVYTNPTDRLPELDGFVVGTPYIGGVPYYGWLPTTAPMLLIPGVPVRIGVCCGGFSLISVEVRAGASDPLLNQGEDQVVFNFSASQ
jgi:hypothetical protein